MFEELDDLLPLFFAEIPYRELWQKLRQHFLRFADVLENGNQTPTLDGDPPTLSTGSIVVAWLELGCELGSADGRISQSGWCAPYSENGPLRQPGFRPRWPLRFYCSESSVLRWNEVGARWCREMDCQHQDDGGNGLVASWSPQACRRGQRRNYG